MKPVRRVVLLAIAMVTALIPTAPFAAAATGDLFISEYIEGSSNNKAIEIYNGTGASVDLAADSYSIQMYFNGSSSAGLTIDLTGTVADGDVYVVAQSSADPAVLAQADQTNGSGWFNGDDAVVLAKAGAAVDAFGQVGFDPGSQWAGGGQDDTLRRKANICAGDTNTSDAFDASVEWDVFAQNTFDGLGSHTADCGGVVEVGPVINEFSASTAGTDVEYIEIFGAPLADHSNLTILEIEGDSSGAGVIDEVIPVGTLDGAGFGLTSLAPNTLENGTITLLLVEDFTGSLSDDLDTNNDGVLDTTPWSSVVDDVAVFDGGSADLTYASTVLGPDYDGLSSFAPGGASRIPDGADTNTSADWVRNDFDLFGIPGFVGTQAIGEAVNTPGATNVEITVLVDPEGVCGDAATFIHDIQGSGLVSGDIGNIREIEGVVVGDFQDDVGANGDLNGFHVQEEDSDADGDAATSEGIFVFQGSNPTVDVKNGDVVRVRGSVTEFSGLTEINNLESVVVCGTGTATAATPSLPVASIDDFEAFEGMAVTFTQTLTISEFFNFDRFGEVVLTPGRLFQPTAVFEPGSLEAAAAADLISRSRITLDDGRTSQNPDPAIHPNGAEFDLDNLFRGGDTLDNVTGVMDYGFGLYRIQPTQGADYTSVNERPDTPEPVGSSLTVASFNVLNYYNTIDDGVNDICGPLLNQECRGADNEVERIRQLDKIVAAMDVMDADVLGIIEVENTTDVEAMADIVGGLNDLAGFGKYAYVDTGTVGTDAIKVGFIYQPGTVTPAGDFAVLDDPAFVAPFGVDRNRAALAQTFVESATGGKFTAVVNHLKSKGSGCGEGDDDPEQGSCNLTRSVSAQVLADWLAGDPTGSGDPDVLIIGDLNSYDKEDPIGVLLSNGYTDLLGLFGGEFAYSYVFDSQLGYLDYGMANASLLSQVTGTTAWHINADEPDLIDYDTSFKGPNQDAIYAPDPYRSSDHDPVIVGLDLNASPSCVDAEPSIGSIWPPNHQMVDIEILGCTDADGDAITITIDSIFQDEPVNADDDGNTAPDGDGIGTSIAQVRAERSGEGDGRVYHITFTATDAVGNSTSGEVIVTVRLSKKEPAVDGGPLYDSTIVP
jgi:predicted extracellular nuclease